MMHENRQWCVKPVASPEELAGMLTESTWCLCDGFELEGYWFLNDATGADGAQEYAIVKIDGPGEVPVQVESITMSWCTEQKALGHIRETIAGEYDDHEFAAEVRPQIDSPEEHSTCRFCA